MIMIDSLYLPPVAFFHLSALKGIFIKTPRPNFCRKSPELLTGVDVDVFQWFYTSLDASRVQSRSASSYFPFLRSCAAMALASTTINEIFIICSIKQLHN